MIRYDLRCAPEQEPRLAGLDHGQIIKTVSGGNGIIADLLQGFDGRKLGVLDPHPEAGDFAVLGDFQLIAEQSRHTEACRV